MRVWAGSQQQQHACTRAPLHEAYTRFRHRPHLIGRAHRRNVRRNCLQHPRRNVVLVILYEQLHSFGLSEQLFERVEARLAAQQQEDAVDDGNEQPRRIAKARNFPEVCFRNAAEGVHASLINGKGVCPQGFCLLQAVATGRSCGGPGA
jgi:hypothetical protein